MLAADVAAAANPLLGPTARTVAHTVERWADEDAAIAVADRTLAARTLARTALLMHRGRTAVPGTAALGVMNDDVPSRVQALLAPPPRHRPAAVAALVALTLTCTVATAAVQHLGEQLFEHAGAPTHVSADASRPTLNKQSE
jgi:hypothetical protein